MRTLRSTLSNFQVYETVPATVLTTELPLSGNSSFSPFTWPMPYPSGCNFFIMSSLKHLLPTSSFRLYALCLWSHIKQACILLSSLVRLGYHFGFADEQIHLVWTSTCVLKLEIQSAKVWELVAASHLPASPSQSSSQWSSSIDSPTIPIRQVQSDFLQKQPTMLGDVYPGLSFSHWRKSSSALD